MFTPHRTNSRPAENSLRAFTIYTGPAQWFYPFMQRPWKRECLSSLSYLFFLIFNAHLLRFLVNWHPANLVQPLAWDQALQWGGKGEKNSASDASWAKVAHVRESMTVLDSGFHAVDSGFQLLDSGFQLSEFRIPKRAGFQFYFLF